jgi:hypothetical protein
MKGVRSPGGVGSYMSSHIIIHAPAVIVPHTTLSAYLDPP